MHIRIKVLSLVFLFFSSVTTVEAAVSDKDNNPSIEKREPLTEEQKARLEFMQKRVAQIKAMDRSRLTKAERRELRRELKDLNKEAKKMSGKSFILVLASLIAVILLLILLL